MIRPPPSSPLFPYTTLSRSRARAGTRARPPLASRDHHGCEGALSQRSLRRGARAAPAGRGTPAAGTLGRAHRRPMLRRTEEVARGHRGAAPGRRDRRCARAHDARVRAGAVGSAAGSASASCRVARATAAQRQPGLGCCHRARRTRRLRRGLHLAQPGGGRGSGARHNPPARGNHGARVSGLAPRSADRASAQASGTVALTPPRSIAVSCSLIAALVCALPSCGHAQSGAPVTGTVTEPDGRPLSGVVVAVQGLGLSVATNATGRYVLSRVPAGQQLLQFRRVGYAAREVTVTVTAGTPATADAVLDPQPIELGTVLVEGVSRAPDRMIDAPAAVDVVRPATAEPVSITGQVPLALARVPGLDVTRSEEHTSELQSQSNLVCRLLLEKKK